MSHRSADDIARRREAQRARRAANPERHRQRNAAWKKANRLHGIYWGIRGRCERPSHRAFAQYGAVGITVCERWKSYQAFRDDMGDPPSPMHSIDRIDNARGYSPDNCRWATPVQQARNHLAPRLIAAFGERKLAVEWVEDPRCAVSAVTLRGRLRRGVPAEQAITAQPMSRAACASVRWTP